MLLLTVHSYPGADGRTFFMIDHNGVGYGGLSETKAIEEIQSILHSANKRTQIDELRAKANELAERANDLEKQLDKSTHGC